MPHAGTAVHNFQYVDPKNSTDVPLAVGETFTGSWVETLQFPTVMLALYSDVHCAYYIQYSTDTVNVDSTLSFEFHPERVEPPKRLTNSRRYYRVVITNNSGVEQTALRCQAILGHHPLLNAPVNGLITQDSDAIVTRAINFEDEIALGKYQSIDLWQKFGANLDVDTATVPEDIWTIGGTYTGFPATAEEFTITLSDAGDIGSDVTFYYLEGTDSPEYKTATITTTGLVTNTGITGLRSSRGIFNSGSAANIGTVTLHHITTTANIFWRIEVGVGQTEVAVFTVPANNCAIIRSVNVGVSKANSAVITGALWIQQLGRSPVTASPGTASQTSGYSSAPFGGTVLQGFCDIAMRISTCSANNVSVIRTMAIVLVNED